MMKLPSSHAYFRGAAGSRSYERGNARNGRLRCRFDRFGRIPSRARHCVRCACTARVQQSKRFKWKLNLPCGAYPIGVKFAMSADKVKATVSSVAARRYGTFQLDSRAAKKIEITEWMLRGGCPKQLQ